MKKTLVAMLALSLACLVLLAGCKTTPGNTTTTPTTNPNNTTVPTSPTTTPTTTPDTTTDNTTTTSPSAGGSTSGAAGVLTTLIDKSGHDFGMTFEEQITAETCESYLGLTAQQFEDYVTEAFANSAAISSVASLTAVIQCKSADDAKTVKGLIAAGFDTSRWVCVFPQQCFVVEFGEYVLLSAGTIEAAQALELAVADYAGDTAGETDVFYTGQ